MTKKFKPLLLSTELRNPTRFSNFLEVLYSQNNKELTRDLVKNVYLKLFEQGYYQPTRFSSELEKNEIKKRWDEGELLTSSQTNNLYELNPQRHGQKGFDYGWCSRWKTHYFIFKRLGFVNFTYQSDLEDPVNQSDSDNYKKYRSESLPLTFTDIGKKFIESNNESEKTALYINGFTKMQRGFLTEDLNKNIPLTLLLKTLKLLISVNDKGISNYELLIWGYWKNNNAEELFNSIMLFRKKFGSDPSFEQIEEFCRDEVQNGDIQRNLRRSGIIDNYKRYLHLTGLFTIRGAGRYLSISDSNIDIVNYLIDNYSDYIEFSNEEDYLSYLQTVDKKIIDLVTKKEISVPIRDYRLNELLEIFGIDLVKNELSNLTNYKDLSKNPIIKTLSDPKRLEFLTSIYLKSVYSNAEVKPNYIPDDEGIIQSFAPNSIGDIVVEFDNKNATLYEVTMKRGTVDQEQSIASCVRHLIELRKNFPYAKAVIIAPVIHQDTKLKVDMVCIRSDNDLNNGDVTAMTIDEFISVENSLT